MKPATALCAGLVTMTMVTAASVFAQQPPQTPKADCQAKAPQKVDGQVMSVDPNGNKVTIKDKAGTTHEFQMSKDMVQTMKPGDTIEATLREAPKC
jgi:Cu/Ag efflux protein CusF